ncbi:hypothetical protein B0H19DRAFT_1260332 [Mycena capillaripes]|nr:hypothetical protein B0H19DRAFT_1260332 [Mycena capillaripes]
MGVKILELKNPRVRASGTRVGHGSEIATRTRTRLHPRVQTRGCTRDPCPSLCIPVLNAPPAAKRLFLHAPNCANSSVTKYVLSFYLALPNSSHPSALYAFAFAPSAPPRLSSYIHNARLRFRRRYAPTITPASPATTPPLQTFPHVTHSFLLTLRIQHRLASIVHLTNTVHFQRLHDANYTRLNAQHITPDSLSGAVALPSLSPPSPAWFISLAAPLFFSGKFLVDIPHTSSPRSSRQPTVSPVSPENSVVSALAGKPPVPIPPAGLQVPVRRRPLLAPSPPPLQRLDGRPPPTASGDSTAAAKSQCSQPPLVRHICGYFV